MRKIILLAVLFCTITGANAQEDFNKWSIDLGGGVHLPVFPVSQNYEKKTLAVVLCHY